MMRGLVMVAGLLALLSGCAREEEEPIQEPKPLFDAAAPIPYPVDLWDRGLEGETMLAVLVNAAGRVDTAYVYESSGHPQFDSAAVAAAKGLRFEPGRQGDRRVARWARIPVRFERNRASARGTEAGEDP